MEELLKVKDLKLYSISNGQTGTPLLHSIDMEVLPGEVIAVVGRSGSGKSLLARSILRIHPPGRFRMEGEISFDGQRLDVIAEKELEQIRGKQISIIFQEPVSYLNPVLRMGKQIMEPLRRHFHVPKQEAQDKAITLLEQLKVAHVHQYLRQYPHQVSGGMAQRGMVAMSALCMPKLIIADEPTSSLDVVNQEALTALLKDLSVEKGIAVLFITHDLLLASKIAHRVLVMEQGRIIEKGTVREVLHSPKNPLTKAMIDSSVHTLHANTKEALREEKETKERLLTLKAVGKQYGREKVLEQVSFQLMKGESLGILGESGCGKSTLLRILARLITPSTGTISYRGKDIFGLKRYPRDVQMIFQDPFSSFNPRMCVGDIISEGVDIQKTYGRKERVEKVIASLSRVGLDQSLRGRYPHELSGGQRQRVGIARALIVKPEVMLCDEPTSYLDTVSQAQVLGLFEELKRGEDLAYLFVTHDVHILKYLSDRIMVMCAGRIVEEGKTQAIIGNPLHPYTQQFTGVLFGKREEYPEKRERAKEGCPFYPRCPKARERCSHSNPPRISVGGGHSVACHYPG